MIFLSYFLINVAKNERLTDIIQAVRCHIYDHINTIYQFIKPFLGKKMSIFEEYGAFNIKPFLESAFSTATTEQIW